MLRRSMLPMPIWNVWYRRYGMDQAIGEKHVGEKRVGEKRVAFAVGLRC